MGIQTLVAAQSDGWIRSTLQHRRRMLGLRLRLVVAVVLVTVAAEADVAADDADVAADVPFSQPQWPTRAGCQRLFTAPTANSCVHVGQELVLEITCVSASCEELIDGWVEPFKRRLFRGKIFHPHSSNEVPVADRWS